MTLGELLSTCRELKRLSLRNVEKKTGISNAYISQLETGKAKNPSLRDAAALAKCYGITVQRIAACLEAT
jgi:HTH-type transcriptional regulator, competence development regulator